MWKLFVKSNKNVPEILRYIETMIKNGNPDVDKMFCAFKINEENNIIHMLTLFDLVDLNPKPIIKEISLYSSI